MDTSGLREGDGEAGKGKITFCPQKVGPMTTIMVTMMMRVC